MQKYGPVGRLNILSNRAENRRNKPAARSTAAVTTVRNGNTCIHSPTRTAMAVPVAATAPPQSAILLAIASTSLIFIGICRDPCRPGLRSYHQIAITEPGTLQRLRDRVRGVSASVAATLSSRRVGHTESPVLPPPFRGLIGDRFRTRRHGEHAAAVVTPFLFRYSVSGK